MKMDPGLESQLELVGGTSWGERKEILWGERCFINQDDGQTSDQLSQGSAGFKLESRYTDRRSHGTERGPSLAKLET